MRPILPVAATALSLALVALASLLFTGPSNAQSTTNIEVDNFYFCDSSHQGPDNPPCDTTVNVGDTVTWNVTTGPHTITQCDDSFTTCPPTGGFDSGTKNSGESFSQTFTTAGTFAYHCNIHPTMMRGRITVMAAQASGSPTATAAGTANPTASAASTAAPTSAGTTTPAASRTAAAVPTTGGDPGDDGAGWLSLLAIAGGTVLIAGGSLSFGLLRRRTA